MSYPHPKLPNCHGPRAQHQAFLSLEREFSRGDLEMPHASREVPLLEPSHMGQRQGLLTLNNDG